MIEEREAVNTVALYRGFSFERNCALCRWEIGFTLTKGERSKRRSWNFYGGYLIDLINIVVDNLL